MYNPEHNRPSAGATSPRISFSTDFVDSLSNPSSSSSFSLYNPHHHIRAAAYRDAPVSSDFEFSVGNDSMMSADELFFKGKMLPLKEASSGFQKTAATTTVRDELLNREGEEGRFSLRPPKNSTRWRGFLGIGKSHKK